MDVPIYNTKNAAIADADFSLEELPEVPEWFQEALLDCGGTCDGFPNVRVVSGLDANLTEFYGGEWHRKYAYFEHDTVEYNVLHSPDGKKRILSPHEAKVLANSPKNKGIILPVKEHHRKEFGIPRYFVEYYKPSEVFGLPEVWESERYMIEEDGTKIDLMGEFPSQGKYETWFCIEEPVIRFGEVIETTFRQLDDVVLELIKMKVEEAKTKSLAAQHNEAVQERLKTIQKHFDETRENIKDIVTDRVERLID